MKTLVVYYSSTGNNAYLAKKITESLDADCDEIKVGLNVVPLIMVLSFLKMGIGIRKITHDVSDYDQVILCGPIWAGQLLAPMRAFVNKYKKNIKMLHFATCCGSYEEMKDKAFGYNSVFTKLKAVAKEQCGICNAFPIRLVLPEEKREDGDAVMKARLSDSNFNGEIKERFDAFIDTVKK